MTATGYTRLSGVDAMMLWMDRGSTYNHTLKIMVLDPSSAPGGWSFERYRTMLRSHTVAVPMLRKRFLRTPLDLHQPVWVVDPDFDVDAHLYRVSCPAPGGTRDFCSLVEQIYAHPLDHDRPLWQVWAIEGLEDGRVALATLMHHAYTDGAGMGAIIGAVASPEPQPYAEPQPSTGPVEQVAAAPLPSTFRRLVWAVSDLPATLATVPPGVAAVRQRRRLERSFATGVHADRPSPTDRKQPEIFGGRLARSRRFACQSFPFGALQEIRAALGGTVNDVYLCCVAGALRRFLLARNLSRVEPLAAAMAFVTKPAAERQAQGGNFSVGDDVWLHPEIADPVERLAATRRSAQATKDHFNAVSEADPMPLLDVVPGAVWRTLFRLNQRTDGAHSPTRNVLTSNVPGPREIQYLGEWRADQWFSTGQLLPGATVNFTAWSYAGQFNACVLSGSPGVPDAWELMSGLQESLDELVSLARACTSAAPTTDRERA